MRHAVLLLGLLLMVFATASPLVEAAVSCTQECPNDDPPGGCSSDSCCSCCVHFRTEPPTSPDRIDLRRAVAAVEPAVPRACSPSPRDILHVPKPVLR